jgi:RNA polymerase sigma-70 factor (ECF subfamily)
MKTPSIRFETLIEQYHDEIFRYLWRMMYGAGRSEADADAQDLTQEVFLRAFQAFGRLRPDSNHRAWLYKIATNQGYTALKRGRRYASQNQSLEETLLHLPQDPHPLPEQQAALNESVADLRGAIQRLPPQQRAAVVLRHLQGLSYSEIATALDCSQDSARANVYQGLRRLRQELGEGVPEL